MREPLPQTGAVLHVAVGVIANPKGEVLVARRPVHLHMGGLWEFPGGKVEAGETVEVALGRELQEELAITVVSASPLLTIRHAYPERTVFLDVWRVDEFDGRPEGQENQEIRWVAVDELRHFEFPPANRPIVTAARLPDCYAIIDGENPDPAALFAQLQYLDQRGYRLVQLRAKCLPASVYRSLAEKVVEYGLSRGVTALLNAEPALALELGAAGVHLNSRALMGLDRRPLGSEAWVAASCHDLDQLQHAEALGLDFAVLSPVLATATHPAASPLGWCQFSAMVDKVNLPVFALGGMRPEHLSEAKRHGAQGIAGIRGFALR